jgi:hypothetical protein
MDVESVCTDQDLEDKVLGRAHLQNLLPKDWLDVGLGRKVATIARTTALREVLEALARRRPPVREADLVYPSELKNAVCYAALRDIYYGAITHAESPYGKQAKHYASQFSQELSSLQPTVNAGVSASSLSIRISRG